MPGSWACGLGNPRVLTRQAINQMAKQKRYTNESQILCAIDRAHELEEIDIRTIHDHRLEIARLRPFSNQGATIEYHNGQVDLLEKRVKGRANRLARMKEKLAEFRTLTFPGMDALMMPNTIAR